MSRKPRIDLTDSNVSTDTSVELKAADVKMVEVETPESEIVDMNAADVQDVNTQDVGFEYVDLKDLELKDADLNIDLTMSDIHIDDLKDLPIQTECKLDAAKPEPLPQSERELELEAELKLVEEFVAQPENNSAAQSVNQSLVQSVNQPVVQSTPELKTNNTNEYKDLQGSDLKPKVKQQRMFAVSCVTSNLVNLGLTQKHLVPKLADSSRHEYDGGFDKQYGNLDDAMYNLWN